MIHTIIIPLSDPQQDTDGIAERAIASVRLLADPGTARIILVSAIDDEAVRSRSQAYLDHVAGTIPGDVVTEVAFGAPGEVILRVAARAIDPAIVMASHGRRGVQLRVFGSTTAAVVSWANCPVLVLPASPDMPFQPAAHVRRVLLPMNDATIATAFADSTVATLGEASARAMTFHLVEVAPPIAPQPAIRTGIRYQGADEVPAHFLRRVAQELDLHGIRATWSLRIGDPAREVVRLVESDHVDLIAMPA